MENFATKVDTNTRAFATLGNNAEKMKYHEHDAATGTKGAYYQEEEKESRGLTQEEIWDEPALVEAWNSATAGYEVRVISRRSHVLTCHLDVSWKR